MSNTEYTPTKCRITRPQPPKPATNPLQFVKVLPCDLSRRAQEQIKKVEEIKVTREVVKEDAEDWQHNLDNWKSSRKKQQEHIIERVVEVKKMELEDHEKGRRKTKTFNEMLEDKSRGRHKFNIPIYDDDSNDLSDYGIGSSSSKTNSIKDVDTDDNSSLLDEKENNHKELCGSNQSQSEDEQRTSKHPNKSSVLNRRTKKATLSPSSSMPRTSLPQTELNSNTSAELPEQYTYEGAIQDYRTRICSKINVDESIFNKQQDVSKSKEFSEAQNLLTKGNLLKRKEIFDKSVEISSYESTTARRLSEDFANSQSIKERLQSLEKCTDIPLRSSEKGEPIVSSVRSKVQSFTKQTEAVDTKNNNVSKKKPESPTTNNNNKTIASYLIEKNTNTLDARNNQYRQNNKGNAVTSNGNNNNKEQERECFERPASPESEMFLNKLNEFNRDLDTIYGKSDHPHLIADDFVTSVNYPASTSSTELMALSSDREDSGIHTADVSCSVSQADEPFEDTESTTNVVLPNCIENIAKENTQHEQTIKPIQAVEQNCHELEAKQEKASLSLLESERRDSEQCQDMMIHSPLVEHIEETIKDDDISEEPEPESEPEPKPKPKQLPPAIYENVEINNTSTSTPYSTEYFNMTSYSSSLEPPKMKPPPPPPIDTDEEDARDEPHPPLSPLKSTPVKRVNSTKRIKKEQHIKRSSFLGLESPTDDQFDPEIGLEKPPDINNFLKKELRDKYKIPNQLYRDREYSEVESQDSGLDIDRGRLSSDTWCTSSTVNVHKRQDSEQTTSFTSEEPEEPEEDEIAKKEREIIALVEKEEKQIGTDFIGYPMVSDNKQISPRPQNLYDSGLGSQKFDSPFCPQAQYEPIDTEQDSEVLKVEHELLQLEREELERQREHMLFRENRAKRLQLQQQQYRLHNSYENICDIDTDIRPIANAYNTKEELLRRPPGDQQREQLLDYRKSMPELQHLPQDYRTTTRPLITDITPSTIDNVELSYYHAQAHAHSHKQQHKAPYLQQQHQQHNHRKSMPDIQHAYTRSMAEYCASTNRPMPPSQDHRKSMPELLDMDISIATTNLGQIGQIGQQGGVQGFTSVALGSTADGTGHPKSSSNSTSSCSSGLSNRPHSVGTVFLQHHQQHDRRDKERFMMHNPVESDAFISTHHHHQHSGNAVVQQRPNALNRHTLHALSAAPKSRPMDNWLVQQQPTTINKPPINQHWLCQEAELRRLADTNLHQSHRVSAPATFAGGGAKHIPDAVIQTLTQRVANRGVGERVPIARNNNLLRMDVEPNNLVAPLRQKGPQQQQNNGSGTFGRALPMPNYAPSNGTQNAASDEGIENKKLSVSGRKKCSYCGVELGRGAAMIIESLCLFYHMACFKCCVCCVPLGDGLIGTDVRVRNDKLHCHNCYSSDDGVKFSCV